MSRRVRRPHRLAFRLTAQQMDEVTKLRHLWGTFNLTHTFERMIEHCGWELLVKAAAPPIVPAAVKKPEKNGDGKSTPRPTRRNKKGGKP